MTLQAGLTRIHVLESPEAMGRATARHAADALLAAAAAGRECVFWVMAAPSAFPFYVAFIGLANSEPELAKTLARTHFFQFDDYPISRQSPQFPATFRHLLQERLFNGLAGPCGPLERIHSPEFTGTPSDAGVARAYTQSLLELKRSGAFILQLKGIGMDGHWGFHGAETPLDGDPAMLSVPMNEANRHQQALDWPVLFQNPENVPAQAYTFNVAMFLLADEILDNVPQASKEYAVLGCYGNEQIVGALPSSALKSHPKSTAYLTRASARSLMEFREAGLSAAAHARLRALWADPAKPAESMANIAAMERALKELGML
jgi:6-phosphogluconolactonase/glucosamine-6-phosphate isomerase/deaminase